MIEDKTKKSHIENIEDILRSLVWWINYDTILTELRYDLEYLGETDVEKFVDYCYKVCSKEELEEGRYSINRPVVEHFIEKVYAHLEKDKRTRKVDDVFKEIASLLNVPMSGFIAMSNETITKILHQIEEKTGEGPLEKTKKRIKVAVALQWLQDENLLKKLTKETQKYIKRLGDFYGLYKKGERVTAKVIGAYAVPEDDIKALEEDYSSNLSIAIYVASNDVEKAKKAAVEDISESAQFSVIKDAVTRIKKHVEGRMDQAYDQVERFKDTIFIAIIINYLQDPHIPKTESTTNLIKWIVPLYNKYKTQEKTKKPVIN